MLLIVYKCLRNLNPYQVETSYETEALLHGLQGSRGDAGQGTSLPRKETLHEGELHEEFMSGRGNVPFCTSRHWTDYTIRFNIE